MRVPLSWLQEFVKLPAEVSVEALAEKLTLAGLEVAKIDYIGVPQGAAPQGVVVPPSDHLVWDRDKIVLGYIHEVKPHPDADRLVLAMVDHGMGDLEQIVTGAPNLFQYRGIGTLTPPIPVPIAREGAEVYDGHADEPGKRMVLKERKIRGIPNRHMVCSQMELGISDEHDGVLLLEPADYDQPAGTPFVDVLGDVVLDIELTPNLARCFSMLGIAREVSAVLNLPLQEPDYNLPEPEEGATGHIDDYVGLEIREAALNPRFTMGLITDVELKPSPAWMQRRLKLIGQRPINNLVDVTNYVMFEIGQPLHAFDYDILRQRAGASKPVVITRLADPGETLTTLDGKQHQLQAHNLLVGDQNGALSMAGVMGGLESEVQDQDGYQTQNLLLEAAAWNLINIRQTLSSTKLHSEASARFSRGVHPGMAIKGLARGLRLLLEVSGGRLVPGIIDQYPVPPAKITLDLPNTEVTRLLGFEIPVKEVFSILQRLGFVVTEKDAVFRVRVPETRLDIGEGVVGQADLIEEIARVYGYNRIPDKQIGDSLPPQRSNLSLTREERTRDLLAGAGLREVISYRLTTPESEARLIPAGQSSPWQGMEYVRLANPISLDKTVMRHTLLASLLDHAVANLRHHDRVAIFEVGSVYFPRPDTLPLEPARLGILLTGQRATASWNAVQQGNFDFYDLKGVVEALLTGLRIEASLVRYERGSHASFHPGRVAQLSVGGEVIGVFGEVHPRVVDAFDLPYNAERPVLAAEFDLDALLAFARPDHQVKPIPTQPAVYQDMAVLVDRQLSAAEVEQVIWKAGGDLLVDVHLFDVYTGEPIPTNKKSLAYSLTYQHPEETLTDQRVAKAHQKIVKAVEHQLSAELRK